MIERLCWWHKVGTSPPDVLRPPRHAPGPWPYPEVLANSVRYGDRRGECSGCQDGVVEEYVLATGEAGYERLVMLERLYGPATTGLLSDLGVGPGWRAADIGCGVGSVLLWLANRIGPGGVAVGVDISEDQLDVASRNARGVGISNVEFAQGSAYHTGLAPASFDLVFARSLLSHLEDPAAAVAHFASLVGPGGLVVCEDIDMSTIVTDPPSRAYERVVELYFELAATNGCDYRVGAKLARLLRHAGLVDVGTRQDQPRLARGEDKRWWEHTFEETAPAMLAAGVLQSEEYARLLAEMSTIGADTTTVVCQPTHHQAWGRVPTS